MSRKKATEATWDSDDELLADNETEASTLNDLKDEELDEDALLGISDEEDGMGLGEEIYQQEENQDQGEDYHQTGEADDGFEDSGEGYQQDGLEYDTGAGGNGGVTYEEDPVIDLAAPEDDEMLQLEAPSELEDSNYDANYSMDADTTQEVDTTQEIDTTQEGDLSHTQEYEEDQVIEEEEEEESPTKGADAEEDEESDSDDEERRTGRGRFRTERSNIISLTTKRSVDRTHIPDTLDLSDEAKKQLDDFQQNQGNTKGWRGRRGGPRFGQRGPQQNNRAPGNQIRGAWSGNMQRPTFQGAPNFQGGPQFQGNQGPVGIQQNNNYGHIRPVMPHSGGEMPRFHQNQERQPYPQNQERPAFHHNNRSPERMPFTQNQDRQHFAQNQERPHFPQNQERPGFQQTSMTSQPRKIHINPNFRGSVQARPEAVIAWDNNVRGMQQSGPQFTTPQQFGGQQVSHQQGAGPYQPLMQQQHQQQHQQQQHQQQQHQHHPGSQQFQQRPQVSQAWGQPNSQPQHFHTGEPRPLFGHQDQPFQNQPHQQGALPNQPHHPHHQGGPGHQAEPFRQGVLPQHQGGSNFGHQGAPEHRFMGPSQHQQQQFHQGGPGRFEFHQDNHRGHQGMPIRGHHQQFQSPGGQQQIRPHMAGHNQGNNMPGHHQGNNMPGHHQGNNMPGHHQGNNMPGHNQGNNQRFMRPAGPQAGQSGPRHQGSPRFKGQGQQNFHQKGQQRFGSPPTRPNIQPEGQPIETLVSRPQGQQQKSRPPVQKSPEKAAGTSPVGVKKGNVHSRLGSKPTATTAAQKKLKAAKQVVRQEAVKRLGSGEDSAGPSPPKLAKLLESAQEAVKATFQTAGGGEGSKPIAEADYAKLLDAQKQLREQIKRQKEMKRQREASQRKADLAARLKKQGLTMEDVESTSPDLAAKKSPGLTKQASQPGVSPVKKQKIAPVPGRRGSQGQMIRPQGQNVRPQGQAAVQNLGPRGPGVRPVRQLGQNMRFQGPKGQTVRPAGLNVRPQGRIVRPGGQQVRPQGQNIRPLVQNVRPLTPQHGQTQNARPQGQMVGSQNFQQGKIRPNIISPVRFTPNNQHQNPNVVGGARMQNQNMRAQAQPRNVMVSNMRPRSAGPNQNSRQLMTVVSNQQWNQPTNNTRTVVNEKTMKYINDLRTVQLQQQPQQQQQQQPQTQQRKIVMNNPVRRRVVIENLSLDTNETRISQICQAAGPIQGLEMDHNQRKAYVRFNNPRDALKFKQKNDKKMLDLSKISIKLLDG